MQFFKKHAPRQAMYFSDGSGFLGFETVDHETGILATEDARIIREIEACIAGRRGGAEKITVEEYLELQSKKKGVLKPQWREEWQPRKRPMPGPDRLARAAEPVAAEPQKPAPVVVPPGSEASFRPTTSRK